MVVVITAMSVMMMLVLELVVVLRVIMVARVTAMMTIDEYDYYHMLLELLQPANIMDMVMQEVKMAPKS